VRFAIALVLLLTGAATWPALSAQDQTPSSVPQARPVSIWFSAVKNGNEDQLKTAFSESMRRQFDQEGWAKVLMTYQELFRSAFGDYKLEDFSFAFTGGEDSGAVLVTFKGMVMPGLQVVREETGWKVNER
jgi:hypothetical protein